MIKVSKTNPLILITQHFKPMFWCSDHTLLSDIILQIQLFWQLIWHLVAFSFTNLVAVHCVWCTIIPRSIWYLWLYSCFGISLWLGKPCYCNNDHSPFMSMVLMVAHSVGVRWTEPSTCMGHSPDKVNDSSFICWVGHLQIWLIEIGVCLYCGIHVGPYS